MPFHWPKATGMNLSWRSFLDAAAQKRPQGKGRMPFHWPKATGMNLSWLLLLLLLLLLGLLHGPAYTIKRRLTQTRGHVVSAAIALHPRMTRQTLELRNQQRRHHQTVLFSKMQCRCQRGT
jgi:hypothetical protein